MDKHPKLPLAEDFSMNTLPNDTAPQFTYKNLDAIQNDSVLSTVDLSYFFE